MLQCHDVMQIERVFVTTQPCIICTKMLLNTACSEIIYLEPYPHPLAESMWRKAGRSISMMSTEQVIELKELFQVMSGRSESALTMSLEG